MPPTTETPKLATVLKRETKSHSPHAFHFDRFTRARQEPSSLSTDPAKLPNGPQFRLVVGTTGLRFAPLINKKRLIVHECIKNLCYLQEFLCLVYSNNFCPALGTGKITLRSSFPPSMCRMFDKKYIHISNSSSFHHMHISIFHESVIVLSFFAKNVFS